MFEIDATFIRSVRNAVQDTWDRSSTHPAGTNTDAITACLDHPAIKHWHPVAARQLSRAIDIFGFETVRDVLAQSIRLRD